MRLCYLFSIVITLAVGVMGSEILQDNGNFPGSVPSNSLQARQSLAITSGEVIITSYASTTTLSLGISETLTETLTLPMSSVSSISSSEIPNMRTPWKTCPTVMPQAIVVPDPFYKGMAISASAICAVIVVISISSALFAIRHARQQVRRLHSDWETKAEPFPLLNSSYRGIPEEHRIDRVHADNISSQRRMRPSTLKAQLVRSLTRIVSGRYNGYREPGFTVLEQTGIVQTSQESRVSSSRSNLLQPELPSRMNSVDTLVGSNSDHIV
ncbi:hypothetical protein BDQ12DRAFT_677677 [Crucibulum laeve]|uniref:Uncharacterized protein n=1 Tax=Crucibulum laeve TaxID=68775 RepID=A0A5C3MBJ4_9AGAR|nr:hypothetical protein BDQ12DRAFT_677677 [Crucibulum laeve]